MNTFHGIVEYVYVCSTRFQQVVNRCEGKKEEEEDDAA